MTMGNVILFLALWAGSSVAVYGLLGGALRVIGRRTDSGTSTRAGRALLVGAGGLAVLFLGPLALLLGFGAVGPGENSALGRAVEPVAVYWLFLMLASPAVPPAVGLAYAVRESDREPIRRLIERLTSPGRM